MAIYATPRRRSRKYDVIAKMIEDTGRNIATAITNRKAAQAKEQAKETAHRADREQKALAEAHRFAHERDTEQAAQERAKAAQQRWEAEYAWKTRPQPPKPAPTMTPYQQAALDLARKREARLAKGGDGGGPAKSTADERADRDLLYTIQVAFKDVQDQLRSQPSTPKVVRAFRPDIPGGPPNPNAGVTAADIPSILEKVAGTDNPLNPAIRGRALRLIQENWSALGGTGPAPEGPPDIGRATSGGDEVSPADWQDFLNAGRKAAGLTQ